MAAKVVASIMTLVLLAGCNSAANERQKMNEVFTQLMKRPNLTQIENDYGSMFETIRGRLVAEVGVSEWVPKDKPTSRSFCSGDIANLSGAEMLQMNAGTSPGNLPDSKWEQAVAIVTEVAREHGFGSPVAIVNRPSDHEVTFRDPYSGELLFGSGGNTILAVTTGCHLTQQAHQRGAYIPPKEY